MVAGDLTIGDEIVSADGTHGIVDAVVLTDGTAEVYNLTVDEAHTYFVGDGAWLVHNSCTWVPKKNMTSEQHAEKHWNDHKSEFPEYTYASEYIQGAHDFINNPPQTTLICVGSSEIQLCTIHKQIAYLFTEHQIRCQLLSINQ